MVQLIRLSYRLLKRLQRACGLQSEVNTTQNSPFNPSILGLRFTIHSPEAADLPLVWLPLSVCARGRWLRQGSSRFRPVESL